ncbi:sugar ABC transporter ATP-binding protein [Demequina sp. NBRC 110053]|uniref:sugar ABC transporter ATP-binding protein n=1 Tax=Demequina sp. NBRC 110053 TaxID=1570342 RepID=UPI000A050E1C|nr:sugar ABC transporter ATP-binding protein [Demequina sp. NBRC 110053]
MTTDTDVPALVEMRGITIAFPGVLALDGVDFFLRPGEVHSLMGENGAGKSTLIKALTGVYTIDSGTISIAGERRSFESTADAQQAGISTVYQEVNLCTNLSVGENVMLGHEPSGTFGIDWKGVHEAARGHLTSLGLDLDTRSSLQSHSIAIQQLVAIARAMVLDAKVLILDEPTSSLDRGEVEQLFAVIRDLKDKGVAILFVSHFLDQVYEISDRITVLRNGALVGEHLVEDLPRDALVTEMIGRELSDLAALSSVADREIDRSGDPVLRARGLGRKGVLDPADIDAFEGEVVGIAGLLGSGRTELVRLLYGADRADSGTIEIDGQAAKIHSPRQAMAHRMALSSENRRAEGVVADLTVAENMILGLQAQRGWLKPVPKAERDQIVGEYMDALGVRPADPDVPIGNLSGGNQQKVLIARWLATQPELLILDEPTRGIDVGAKADIQRKVAELSAKGLSVIFISSELEEVLRIAQRVVVMRDRRRVGELDSSAVDLDGLIDYIAHAEEGSVSR